MTETWNVHPLPGVTLAECDPVRLPPARETLVAAMNAGLVDVAVVGRDERGEIVVWGSSDDADTVLGLLTRGTTRLAGKTQVPS